MENVLTTIESVLKESTDKEIYFKFMCDDTDNRPSYIGTDKSFRLSEIDELNKEVNYWEQLDLKYDLIIEEFDTTNDSITNTIDIVKRNYLNNDTPIVVDTVKPKSKEFQDYTRAITNPNKKQFCVTVNVDLEYNVSADSKEDAIGIVENIELPKEYKENSLSVKNPIERTCLIISSSGEIITDWVGNVISMDVDDEMKNNLKGIKNFDLNFARVYWDDNTKNEFDIMECGTYYEDGSYDRPCVSFMKRIDIRDENNIINY